MDNIRIMVTDNRTIIVKADTKRYGKDAIMFEGHTFMSCCDYIRRTEHTDHFKLESFSCVPVFTDTEGRTMPWIMNVKIKKEGE